MATNVRAVLMVSFLLMLAITLNASVIQEQGGQENNGEMSREILHDIKQGSIGDGDIDQMKKQLLALLLNDQEAKAQAASHLQSLFEGDLDIPQEEINGAYGKSSEVSDLHVSVSLYVLKVIRIGSNVFICYLHACCKLHSHIHTVLVGNFTLGRGINYFFKSIGL